MKPTMSFRLLSTLLLGGMTLALVAAFWWMLSRQAGLQSQPGALADQPIQGYPAPELSAVPSQVPVESAQLPMSTLLPRVAFQLDSAKLLSDKPDLSFPTARSPRFIRPATDGKTLVGEVITSVSDPFSAYIVSVDLTSGETQKIADVSDVASPQVSDQYVVWIEKSRLNFYDRISGEQGIVDIGEVARNPSLSGSIVVWEYTEKLQTTGERGIWAYDLNSGKDLPVALGATSDPLISGHWVVYEYRDDYDDTTIGLYAANLNTGENFSIGRIQRPTQFYMPIMHAIDPPWVVWSQGNASQKPELHFYNLDARQSMTVPVPSCNLGVHGGRPEQPLISGETVLFQGCFQAMGYNIGSGEFFSVPISQADAQPAGFVGWDFAEGQLVWVSLLDPRGEGQTQIYTAPIAPKEQPQSPNPIPTVTPLVTPAFTAPPIAYP
jgi:hypothetical protein